MEGFNAFEVITADRIVSQVSTEHPYDNGHIPHVTFLGTQFTNLNVSGFPIPLNLNLGICGAKPAGDQSYLRNSTFLEGVREQTAAIANADGLPKELKARYDERLVYVDSLIRASREGVWENDEPRIICSLIQSIGKIPIPGVTSYGNVLVIPDFGSVAFGEIVVGEKNYEDSPRPCVYFELNGMNINMGCVGDGNVTTTTVNANGNHKP
jgi:hypothetical protein